MMTYDRVFPSDEKTPTALGIMLLPHPVIPPAGGIQSSTKAMHRPHDRRLYPVRRQDDEWAKEGRSK